MAAGCANRGGDMTRVPAALAGVPDGDLTGGQPAAPRQGRALGSRGVRPLAVYRWGMVLLMLIAAFTFAMIAPAGAWPRVVTALLQGTAALAALSRAQVDRRLLGLVAGAVAAAGGIAVEAALSGRYLGGISDVVGAGLLALVPVAVVLEF